VDLIIYHNSCADGFCAAYVAHKAYPEAALLAQDYGMEPPYEAVTGKDVLVVDFSWRTREQNEKMATLAKSFHILDHHKSAQEILAGLPFTTFDMKRSGAGLTWDYLLPVPRPWYVDYVEDRDLWRHWLPDSKEINAYLGTLPFTLEAWERMAKTRTPEDAKILGAGALAHIEHYVREGLKQVQQGEIILHGENGDVTYYPVAVVNALYLNISELADEASQLPGTDIGLGWFERGDGMTQFSLRSRHDTDVSVLAKIKGGGGHKNAAGFQVSIEEGRILVDAILGRGLASPKVFYAPMK
jgi:oligoribonuclease NrnB/cAMP/cGMP phosphodiesterase (DHH superfamily)